MALQNLAHHDLDSGFAAGHDLSVVFRQPTVFWFDCSDFMLSAVTACGVVLSLLVTLGICVGPCLLLLWLFYLSICNVDSVFYAFQWDHLLLELTVPLLFLPIWRPLDLGWRKGSFVVPDLVVFLMRWALFRVMFFSGLVKLAKGCLVWSNMTAMAYYYETQLLPSPLAFLAHRLPFVVQMICTLSAFVIEIVGPVLIFCGRQARMIACGAFTLLMILIGLAGNHGYFNFLSCALCLFLIDDQCLPLRRLAQLMSGVPLPGFNGANLLSAADDADVPPDFNLNSNLNEVANSVKSKFAFKKFFVVSFAALIVSLTLLTECLRFQDIVKLPPGLAASARLLSHLGLAGNYGLYDTVFTTRTELEIEGSNDQVHWQPYLFKYKVQQLDKLPPFLLLLQPRLDWRMRFAALSEPDRLNWFNNLLSRLLAGSPSVDKLLSENPFKDNPPAYVRVIRYSYSFETFDEFLRSGRFWRRGDPEEYVEPRALD